MNIVSTFMNYLFFIKTNIYQMITIKRKRIYKKKQRENLKNRIDERSTLD